MLLAAARRALAAAAAATTTTTSGGGRLRCFASVQVVVPSLGESITDGSIAAVLRRAGDAIQENETIAQIETDKVTLDIKAPADGTLLGVVVQEGDTVVPGQLVATLDDAAAKAAQIGGGGGGSAATAATAAAPAAAPAASAAAAPAAASGSGDGGGGGGGGRVPGIRFPPRVLPDGRRVSQLPAAEARAVVDAWRASSPSSGAAAAAAAPAAAPTAGTPASAAVSGAWASSAASPSSSSSAAPSKFATGVSVLERMPPRRELTEAEMERIELGGAA